MKSNFKKQINSKIKHDLNAQLKRKMKVNDLVLAYRLRTRQQFSVA